MALPLKAIIAAYILAIIFDWCLKYLNIAHLKKKNTLVPPEFEGLIDERYLSMARDYSVENTRLSVFASLIESSALLLFLFGGLLDSYDSWVASLKLGFVPAGLVFFLGIHYAEILVGLPLGLYSTFKIEKKYGFNAMTPALWAADLVKSLIISTALYAAVIEGALYCVQKSPNFWWLWIWSFFTAFSVFMMYISPYLIEPLFNKFEPLNDKNLEGDIMAVSRSCGINIEKVLKMDASRRTKHTNAYFTGIGRVKRIVLFDTLLERLTSNEIKAVVAHEAGHWKKRHVLRFFLAAEAGALLFLYITFKAIEGGWLKTFFNIGYGTFYAKTVFLAFLWSITGIPLRPLANYISRRHEKEADSFACRIAGGPAGLIGALIKLSRDNLTNIHPHPLYAALRYSHPPTLQRIRHLKETI